MTEPISSCTPKQVSGPGVEMDYVIDDPSYCDVGKDTLSIRKEGSTYKGGAEYLYVDNLKVTEDITEVKVASAATGTSYAPSLVLHPSEKKEIAAADAAYVENGTNSDMSFTGSDGLLGRREMAGRVDRLVPESIRAHCA